jgi:hypothetical protein
VRDERVEVVGLTFDGGGLAAPSRLVDQTLESLLACTTRRDE